MPHAVKRLEQALCLWEEICFLWNLLSKLESQEYGQASQFAACPAMEHWRKFRPYLLSLRPLERATFDKRFDFCAEGDQMLGAITGTPYDLMSWTVQSRRVYTVPADLSILLSATSLQGLNWKDIHWPFAAFAISLEQPIISDDNTSYDFVLVSQIYDVEKGYPLTILHLFSQALENRKLLGDFKKQELLKDYRNIKPGRKDRAARLWNKIAAYFESSKGQQWSTRTVFVSPNESELPVTTSVDDLYRVTNSLVGFSGRETGYQHPEWDAALRIAVGVCMYLRSLPSEYRPGGPRAPITRVEASDSKAIASTAEVCSVAVTFEVNPEIRQVIREGRHLSTREVCARFVEGYHRRPAGKSGDPTAEKTRWVRPYLWGKSRLKDGQLPGGTEKRLR